MQVRERPHAPRLLSSIKVSENLYVLLQKETLHYTNMGLVCSFTKKDITLQKLGGLRLKRIKDDLGGNIIHIICSSLSFSL